MRYIQFMTSRTAGRRIKGQGSKWCRRSTRLAIYSRDGFACVYCRKGIDDGMVLTLDHVLACEVGGTNAPENLVTACVHCNSAKQHRTMREWLAALRRRGVNTDGMAQRIRRQTAKVIDREEGRRLAAAR